MRGLTKAYVLRRFLMLLLTVWLGATVLFVGTGRFLTAEYVKLVRASRQPLA
jgi:hypothetical protein